MNWMRGSMRRSPTSVFSAHTRSVLRRNSARLPAVLLLNIKETGANEVVAQCDHLKRLEEAARVRLERTTNLSSIIALVPGPIQQLVILVHYSATGMPLRNTPKATDEGKSPCSSNLSFPVIPSSSVAPSAWYKRSAEQS